MITANDICKKAERAYARFLSAWVQGDDAGFFPLQIRCNLSPIRNDLSGTIAAVEALRANSRAAKGWGYTIHWKQVRSREFGNNRFPERITVDTLDDLLRLASHKEDFAAISSVAGRLRSELPKLSEWTAAQVRSLAHLFTPIEGLIEVAKFFLSHPWPDCYAREIPVSVDTKFVERHQSVLREWLDELLPASAIQVDETKFSLRFGLRDRQPHTTMRILDPDLQSELRLPFDEFSVPLRLLATLPVQDVTVVIVENQLNLLTLPPITRAIALRGEGDAVTRLVRLKFLNENCVLYWGDIDIEGFESLSILRRFLPHVSSLMMDRETLNQHSQYIVQGNEAARTEPARLTSEELSTYRICAQARQRLEQERIPQSYVMAVLKERPLAGFELPWEAC